MKPKGGWLTVNKKCNLRCKWCYAKGTDYLQNNNMSFKLAKKLTLLMKDTGIKQVIIIGGEPTLWKPLFEYNDFCREIGITTVLVTNGVRFGSSKFYKEYLKHPSDIIGVSLKAGTSKQLYQVAQSKAFYKIQKGLYRISKLESTIGITYNTFYRNNLIDLSMLAKKCGFDIFKIDFCSTTFENGKPSSKYMVHPKQIVEDIYRDYWELNKIMDGGIVLEISIPFCIFPKEFINLLIKRKQVISVCHVIKRDGIIFDYNGNVIMCNGLHDYPIGKYEKDFNDSIELINFLNSTEIQKYYKQISHYPSSKCKECNFYNMCGGGCPLKWAVYKPSETLGDAYESLKNQLVSV